MAVCGAVLDEGGYGAKKGFGLWWKLCNGDEEGWQAWLTEIGSMVGEGSGTMAGAMAGQRFRALEWMA